MTEKGTLCSAIWFVLIASLATLAVTSCKSHSHETTEAEKGGSHGSEAAHPIGGTYCLETFAQGTGPTKVVHFSYKRSVSDGSFKEYEGDLLGDSLDSTIREKRVATDMDREMAQDKSLSAPEVVDGFVVTTRTLHSTRNDRSGWTMGWGTAVQGFTPWSLFVAKPNVQQAGPETVGDFNAMKYSVDTAGQGQLEKMPLTLAGGLKDYTIQGTVSVEAKQRCILQYSIDYDEVLKDGSQRKTHYEGSTRQ